MECHKSQVTSHKYRRKIKIFIFLSIFLVFSFFIYTFYLPSKYVVPILMYHNIDYKNDMLSVTPENFNAQLMFLKKRNYNVISLNELVNIFVYNKKIPAKAVVITFDDGKENNFTNAYRFIKAYRLPATMFVIPGHCGWEGYLTKQELKEMSQNGIDIASHTLNDVWLPDCSDLQLVEEIYGSKKALEEITGKKVDFISYPLGGFNYKVKLAVMKSGYRGGCAVSPGRATANYDIYAFKRIKVTNKDNRVPLSFWFKTSGYYMWFKEMKIKKR